MGKPTNEHIQTRLPLVERLIKLGWDKNQIQYSPEWRVPKSPSEATKREEGKSYTGFPVAIQSDAKLMDIQYDDVIIDPACGSGGFLLECFSDMKSKSPNWDDGDAKAWAQKHLYGVDKDQINIKLTKARMMILGDRRFVT
jgi:hypothetical protein